MDRWILVFAMLAGCDNWDPDNSYDYGEEYEPVPPRERALRGTNISVKELVACGGMQSRGIRSE